jgi:hypothetical protein
VIDPWTSSLRRAETRTEFLRALRNGLLTAAGGIAVGSFAFVTCVWFSISAFLDGPGFGLAPWMWLSAFAFVWGAVFVGAGALVTRPRRPGALLAVYAFGFLLAWFLCHAFASTPWQMLTELAAAELGGAAVLGALARRGRWSARWRRSAMSALVFAGALPPLAAAAFPEHGRSRPFRHGASSFRVHVHPLSGPGWARDGETYAVWRYHGALSFEKVRDALPDVGLELDTGSGYQDVVAVEEADAATVARVEEEVAERTRRKVEEQATAGSLPRWLGRLPHRGPDLSARRVLLVRMR